MILSLLLTWNSVDGSQWPQHPYRTYGGEIYVLHVQAVLQSAENRIEKHNYYYYRIVIILYENNEREKITSRSENSKTTTTRVIREHTLPPPP